MTVDKQRKHRARLVARQTGRTYQGAIRLIENPDVPPPVTGRRDTPHPDGIVWTKLIGVMIAADDFPGVVLPGIDPHHPELLRLHLPGNGEVVQFNPNWFTIYPMPDQVHIPPPGSRRRTHCPDGRYIYRGGELPANVLATQTMLKHHRRRIPEGLAPVATYLGGQGANTYYPLYAVADCIPMPQQTTKQQAAWTTARTCAWCGRTNMYPYTKAWEFGGLRLCGKCSQSGREDKNAADRNAERLMAVGHARALLADPAVVIATVQTRSDRSAPTATRAHGWLEATHDHVEVVDHQGQLLGTFDYTRYWDEGIGRDFDEPARAQLDALRAVLDGRWVLEPDEYEGGSIANDLNYDQNRNRWFNPRPHREDWPDGWSTKLGGQFHWIIGYSRAQTSELPSPWPGNFPTDWAQQKERHRYASIVGGDIPESRAVMWWQILNVIAHGPHPAGPATCPHRAHHDAPRCGSAELTAHGWCTEHTRN